MYSGLILALSSAVFVLAIFLFAALLFITQKKGKGEYIFLVFFQDLIWFKNILILKSPLMHSLQLLRLIKELCIYNYKESA